MKNQLPLQIRMCNLQGPPENGGGGKNNVTTVALKADLHCEGCVYKVLKCIRSFDGVDTANIGDGQRITVVGKVDPAKLRQKVEEKTHKKVELVSPQNKKDDSKNEGNKDNNAKGKENNNGGSDNAKQDKNKEEEDKNSKNKNSGEKKPKQKEIPVSTAVLNVHLHCEGCIQRICKLVTKTKGYQDVKIDRQKGLVTVTGAIDMKALAQVLKKHLKRDVEITPPPAKKEVEKKENSGGGGGENKGKGGGGDKGKSGGSNKGEGGGGDKVKNKGESGGGDKVKSGGGDGGGDGGEKAAGGEGNNRIQFQVGYPYPYTYEPGVIDQFHYNMYAFGPYHAPQMFSDENPNACSIM